MLLWCSIERSTNFLHVSCRLAFLAEFLLVRSWSHPVYCLLRNLGRKRSARTGLCFNHRFEMPQFQNVFPRPKGPVLWLIDGLLAKLALFGATGLQSREHLFSGPLGLSTQIIE